MKSQKTLFLILVFIIVSTFVGTSVYSQAENWRTLGLKYLLAGKPQKAISFFRLAVSADGGVSAYREELAYALQKSGQYEEALTHYTVAIALPGARIADIKYNMALVYAAQGKYNKAVAYITEVINLKPEINSAYLNRANFGINRKDYSGAEADYKTFLEKQPDTVQKVDIEKMLALLAQFKKFPLSNLDKKKYNEKKLLEEELNKQRKRLSPELSNQLLGERDKKTILIK